MIYICIPTTAERRDRLDICIKAIRDNAGCGDFSIITYENYREGCQVAVRKMLAGLGDSLALILNDDMLGEPDFLKNAVDAYQRAFPNNDGLGSLNDHLWYKTIAMIQFAPASLLYNYIYSGYFHYCGDNELADIFRQKNKYLAIDNACINHEHPIYDAARRRPDLQDQTYSFSRSKYTVDKALYDERMLRSNNFKDLSKIDMNVPDYIK